jgi:hypothetical protein
MILSKCDQLGAKSKTQRISLKYFSFNKNNGFTPYRVFSIRNTKTRALGLKVSNDNSLLLATQRYVKVSYPAKNTDDEKFYYDDEDRCLKNYLFNKGCISYVQQGSSFELIALEDTQKEGGHPTEFKYDGSFFWAEGKVVQTQGGYDRMNNIGASLGPITGERFQMWTLVNTNVYANKVKANQQKSKIDTANGGSFGFKGLATFSIKDQNGRVVSLDTKLAVKMKKSTGAASEKFFFDEKSKTLKWKRDPKISLAVQPQQDGTYKLIGTETTGTALELFTKPGANGIIQLSANKDFVWKVVKDCVFLTTAEGCTNWKKNGAFFSIQGSRN